MVAALRSAAVAVAALALWAQPAQAQLRGAAADAADDAAAAAGDEDVDTATMQIRIIGHSLLLAGGIDHFHEVFHFANETMHNDSGCFTTEGMNYTILGNFTGNTSEVRNQYGRSLQGQEDLDEEPDPYLHAAMTNLTLGDYAWCCLNNDNATEGFRSVRRLQSRDWESNTTLVTCYRNETFHIEAKQFEFEKEEEDLVRSHWENFQHPKPTVLYEQLSKNLREEIRTNFIRTQTVKYEHDVVKENLHNESVRVKTLLEEKKLQNRRKMDLLFARHKGRVTGLHRESARVLDELEDKRRETSDHLADLKEDHLATVAALTQNAREVDEHLRVKTEEHMDAMTNYYQRWHDNHEDAEETILNLRRSNGRVGEGVEDAAEFYFGNPEPLFNESLGGNGTNTTDGGDRRRLQEEVVRSEGGYDVISLEDEEDEEDEPTMPRVRPSIGGVSAKGTEPPSDCIAFRQTGGCDSFGPRESHGDDSCAASIQSDRSGYCECRSGRLYRVNCGHAAFTCAAACESGSATEDVAPVPAPESTPQMDDRAQADEAAAKAADAKAADEKVAAEKAAAEKAAAEKAAAAAEQAAAAEAAAAKEAEQAAEPAKPAEVPADPLYAGVSDPTTPGWKPRLGRAPKITGKKPAVTPTKVGKKPEPAAATPPPEPAVADAKADEPERVVVDEAAAAAAKAEAQKLAEEKLVEEKAAAEAKAKAAEEAASKALAAAKALAAEEEGRRNVERLLREQMAARDAAKAEEAEAEVESPPPKEEVTQEDAPAADAAAVSLDEEEVVAVKAAQEVAAAAAAAAAADGGEQEGKKDDADDGAAAAAAGGADVTVGASDGADDKPDEPAEPAAVAAGPKEEAPATAAVVQEEQEADAGEAAAATAVGVEPTPLPDPTPPPMERLMEALRAKQAEAAAKQAAAAAAAAAAAGDAAADAEGMDRREPTERLTE